MADPRYGAYCLSDPEFYDRMDRLTSAADELAVHQMPLPAGWARETLGPWITYRPSAVDIPSQGWKVHASATARNAQRVASAVWDYCTGNGIAFKVTAGVKEYIYSNSKYADRSAGGKLAVIYPTDEAQLEKVLTEMGSVLQGEEGPYVLSDLRWKDGPLYVRYGAFLERTHVDENGVVRSVIADPRGNLVPDPRGPVFSPPDWVHIPDFLLGELERRGESKVEDFPYQIVDALHFSNGGGVYEGRDRATGRRLLIKEARPYAGLDTAGRDAVMRLRAERDVLEQLQGLPCVPELVNYCTLGDHEFLIEEFVEGTPLNRLYAVKTPLTGDLRNRAEVSEYRRWAVRVWESVAASVRAVNGRGIIFGDLHPFNIIVFDNGEEIRTTLVDFEVSWRVGEERQITLEHPGFGAPRDRQGTDVDEYALAALKLSLFVPLTMLVRLNVEKAGHLAVMIAKTFDVPQSFLDDAVATVSGAGREGHGRSNDLGIELSAESWPHTRDSMKRAILASASLDRTDRLFPGDIAQFAEGGGLAFACGAAGILWAMDIADAGRYQAGERWLIEQALRDPGRLPGGFYDGAHGVAYALWKLGHGDAATDLLRSKMKDDWERYGNGLYDGLAGMGLNWLAFADGTGDGAYLDRAARIADILRRRLGGPEDVPETSGGEGPVAGLMHGSSGIALFLVHMFEHTGEEAYLKSARTAFDQDLRRCVVDDRGALVVNEGWRSVPYLRVGSIGIGFALRHYLRVRHDDELQKKLSMIQTAAQSDFYVFSGLFDGRAGMLLFNATAGQARRPLENDAVMAQARGLDWHSLRRDEDIVFPGNELLRYSMDLATGSAGVMLALAAANGIRRDGETVCLPFLS
ncbi:class III lanthionine synthetase LanKC [Sphaerimonospora thailandensis]|uniref:Serine/threonine protein kinase n=1 Tax=Sphaerimonospora thailandensis TaxID=795644 RepID=A0A8J3R7L8_9ACTN|nr:class III lanthionine synthetase LanKC [Sphaerimonospora thailandensis]GIH69938.1 serine/threonine protein kinase [Sphaerimonospora thailandensis]